MPGPNDPPPEPRRSEGPGFQKSPCYSPELLPRVLPPQHLSPHLIPQPTLSVLPLPSQMQSHCPHICRNVRKEAFVPFHLMLSPEYFCICLQIFLFSCPCASVRGGLTDLHSLSASGVAMVSRDAFPPRAQGSCWLSLCHFLPWGNTSPRALQARSWGLPGPYNAL